MPPKAQVALPPVAATWSKLAAVASSIIAITSTFLLPPPYDSQAKLWTMFTRFLVTVCVGLISTMSYKRRSFVFWRTLTITAVLAGTGLLLLYLWVQANWIVPYNGVRVVVGRNYTSTAAEYRESVRKSEQMVLTPHDMIMRSGGVDRDIWPSQEIEQNALVIASLYCLSQIAFSAGIIGLVTVISYRPSRSGGRKRASRA